MENETTASTIDLGRLKRRVVARYLLCVLVLAAALFLPAGTLDYWQAWVYLAVLFVPMAAVLLRTMKKDPALLEQRLGKKEREKKSRQRFLIVLFNLFFLAAFLLPGLDRRWDWSRVPAWLVVAADLIVLGGYFFFIRVVRENRFLTRVIEVVPGQRLVDTGPYARVRHPMYAAVMPLYLFSPLALGSFWALIPATLLPLIILLRIFDEERILSQELAGYRKYARRVKYRLIPRVW